MSVLEFKPGKFEIKYDSNSEILKIQSTIPNQWIVTIENIEIPTSQPVSSQNGVKENEIGDYSLPTVEEIITYITNKPNFEHDNAEIQTKFVGKILNSRGSDQKLYFALDGIIRKAKAEIENKNDGKWETIKTKKIAKRTHIKEFSFVKSEKKPSVMGQYFS